MRFDWLRMFFHSPYDPWGLRYRASKLPDASNDYAQLLWKLADAVESGKVTRRRAREMVKQSRWMLKTRRPLPEDELQRLLRDLRLIGMREK
jgi:hypothetical protein